MDKVSVIIPIYNVEKYLEECLDSVLGQSYTNLEIILVDDGSPDGCPAICDAYAKKDGRIIVIHQENGGLSAARNVGLDVCSGEWIMFVDSDDTLVENAVEALHILIKEKEATLAVGNHRKIEFHESKNLYKICSKVKIEEYTKLQIFSNYGKANSLPVTSWGKMYKAEIFEKIRFPVGKIHEDVFIAPLVYDQCSNIVYTDEIIYNYLQRADSIMGSSKKNRNLDAVEASKFQYTFLYENHYLKSAQKAKLSLVSLVTQCRYRSDFSSKENKKQFDKYHKEILFILKKHTMEGTTLKQKICFSCYQVHPFLCYILLKVKRKIENLEPV